MSRRRRFHRSAHRAPAWLLMPVTAVALAIVTPLPGSAATAAVPASAGTGFGHATEITPPANAAAQPNDGLYAAACPGKGDCVAGGAYTNKTGADEAMVVTQSRGKWARATEVKLPANAAAQPYAEVNSIACGASDSCVAVGYYHVKAGYDQGYIVDQTRGQWGRAVEASLPANAEAESAGLIAVTCTSADACEAAGYYYDRAKQLSAVVISEVSGRWRRGTELSVGHVSPASFGPYLTGIACEETGDCVAVGFYYTSMTDPDDTAALGFIQARGKWYPGTKIALPSSAKSSSGLDSVACVAGGPCLAAGGYATSSTADAAMSALESGDRWHEAASIPVMPPHAVSDDPNGISCASARLCIVAGGYSTAKDTDLALLMTLSNRKWQQVGGVALPANASTTTPHNFLYTVGCASDGYCAAVGFYLTKTDGDAAMATERA
jgi:hypothetical protein